MERRFLADSNVLIYAGQKPTGEIARWLQKFRPYLCDVSYWECLLNWKKIALPSKAKERNFLVHLFTSAREQNRYIETTKNPEIEQRAHTLEAHHNLRINDALIAAAAEHFNLILVTADTRRNFAPRLEQLNSAGLGAFKLRVYRYEEREATFSRWNDENEEHDE